MLLEPGELTMTAQDERSRIERLNASPNGLLIVAEMEGTGALAGMLRAAGIDARRTRHATTIALGVARQHWGKGIASALLKHAHAWSQGSGVVRVELTVHTTNLRAIELYLRHGFVVEGVRRKSLRVDGDWADEYLMALVH